MKKLFLFLLCFLVLPVSAENATPFCTSMNTRIHITTRLGNPKYVTQYSREYFLKQAETTFSPYTLGLTVAKLDITMQTKPQLAQQAGQICVGLADVEIELSYPALTVYIDKKYKPSSCEYQAIKEHEDYHVAVAQQALIFFKRDVENVVGKTIMGLSPKIVYTKSDIQPTVNKFSTAISSALKPLINHINKKLAEKNQAIDTPEMYKATTAVCHNW